MTNDLAAPTDLAHLPGAPFTDVEVDTAVAAIRAVAGWHIAPVKIETVVLDVQCYERWLRLPTLALVSVDQVRDTTDQTAPVVIDSANYRKSSNLGQVISTSGAWPDGYEAVEVDMSHGYAATPDDLLGVIAESAQTVRSGSGGASAGSTVKLGDLSIAESSSSGGGTDSATETEEPLATNVVLRRYSLPKLGFA